MASRDPSEQTFQVNYSTLDLESEGIMDFFNVKIGSSCKITSTQSWFCNPRGRTRHILFLIFWLFHFMCHCPLHLHQLSICFYFYFFLILVLCQPLLPMKQKIREQLWIGLVIILLVNSMWNCKFDINPVEISMRNFSAGHIFTKCKRKDEPVNKRRDFLVLYIQMYQICLFRLKFVVHCLICW